MRMARQMGIGLMLLALICAIALGGGGDDGYEEVRRTGLQFYGFENIAFRIDTPIHATLYGKTIEPTYRLDSFPNDFARRLVDNCAEFVDVENDTFRHSELNHNWSGRLWVSTSTTLSTPFFLCECQIANAKACKQNNN